MSVFVELKYEINGITKGIYTTDDPHVLKVIALDARKTTGLMRKYAKSQGDKDFAFAVNVESERINKVADHILRDDF